MKLRISFVADVTIHGGKVTKDDLVPHVIDWLYDSDTVFTDELSDYIPDDIGIDSIELMIDGVSVR